VRISHKKVELPKLPGEGEGLKRWHKGSKLHQLKPVADPSGNRSERREAKKVKRKKGNSAT
jgi:hypothetical protein